MRTRNKQINLDRANCAADNASKGEETMRNSSKKTPWYLRFAPGALELKEIAATAGIGLLYGLLFAGLLFAPLLPHLAAQSSGTPTRTTSTAQLQDGAQVQWIWRAKPILEKLPWRKWVKWVVAPLGVAVGGNAIWSELNKEWTLPPGATRKGRIQSIATIGLWKMDGQKTHWYSKSGEWAWQSDWGFDNKNPLPNPTYPMPLYDLYNYINSDDYDRDYHYYDYSCQRMMWDADNEIWKADPDGHRHRYGSGGGRFPGPDRINRLSNQGEPGWKYPDHEDYKKGKQGFIIWIGDHVKNYLSHEFKSSVSGEIKNADLKAEAEKRKKDKINPLAFVTVSDMTYKSDGWKYKQRAPSDVHMVTRELSAVEDTSVDLNDKEYIPLNARHEKTKYENNKCIVYWSARTEWRTEDVQVENLDVIFEDQRIPYRYEVPEQDITDYN